MNSLKKWSKTITLVCVLCGVLFVSGCKKTEKKTSIESIQKEGELIVLTNATFPPYEFYSGEQIVGVDIDITKLLAERLGVKHKIVDMNFDGLLPALQNGKGHIVAAGVTLTPENENAFHPSMPYASSSQRILILKKHKEITSLGDLVNKKIGVAIGTTSYTFINNQLTEEPFKDTKTIIVTYQDIMAAVQSLVNGYVAAVILDGLPAAQITKKSEEFELLPQILGHESYVFLLPLNATSDLVDLLNIIIMGIKSDDTLDKIYENYMDKNDLKNNNK
ncbi:MAG: ABC transporter substrate-binding protein [Oscillospiraceae bacterium]|nr:ABC transporter substrate-binding protein [Oscillospiraceae bacterium]